MIDRDDQKRQVQQATDIVRLVGEHVALRARGKEFVGLCPFHDDKHPSMYVSPVKQIYKCFSCGAGGDVFTFAMQYHKMSFPEALKYLADKAGIKLVETRRARGEEQDDGTPTDRQLAAQASSLAVSFFQACYRHAEHGQIARDYIAKRSISAEMIEAFQIGYAPDRWDGLVMMIREKNWNPHGFEVAGMISQRRRDEENPKPETRNPKPDYYDRFRHRLIFPICDAIGRPIAFGGRKLRDEDEPKYLNSPENPLFNKSATLYGLHLAKKPIIDSRTAVIVEGYTDVIACHQAGVRNVVATLGTALTPQHITELRRYCQKVVLIYDGDAAGIKAMDRALEVFLTGELDVALATIADEYDPAELFELPDGIERWNRAVAGAQDALEYQFVRMRQQLEGADTITGRQKLAEEYLRKLAALGFQRTGAIRGAMVIQRLADLLHLSEQTIRDMLARLAPPRSRTADATPATSVPSAPEPFDENPDAAGDMTADVDSVDSPHKIKSLRLAERQLIGALLREPGLFHQSLPNGTTLDEAVIPGDFVTAAERHLYELVYQRLADGQEVSLPVVLAELAERGWTSLSGLATQADGEVDAAAGDDPQRIGVVLTTAAEAIVVHHREHAAAQNRAAIGQGNAEQESQLLRQIVEHRRANPSPARIGRVGT